MSLRFRERRMEQKKRERSEREATLRLPALATHTLLARDYFQPVKMIENYIDDDNAHPHLL